MHQDNLISYRNFGEKYGRETLQEARNNRIHRSRNLLNEIVNESEEELERKQEKRKFQRELDSLMSDIEKASFISEDTKKIIQDLKMSLQKGGKRSVKKSKVQKGSGNSRVSSKIIEDIKNKITGSVQKGSGKTTKKRSTKKCSTKKRSTKKRSTKKRSTKKRSAKKRKSKSKSKSKPKRKSKSKSKSKPKRKSPVQIKDEKRRKRQKEKYPCGLCHRIKGRMNEKCFKCICRAKCKKTGRCKPGHCAEKWRADKKARRSRSPTHTPYFPPSQSTSTITTPTVTTSTATFTNL